MILEERFEGMDQRWKRLKEEWIELRSLLPILKGRVEPEVLPLNVHLEIVLAGIDRRRMDLRRGLRVADWTKIGFGQSELESKSRNLIQVVLLVSLCCQQWPSYLG